MKPSWSWYMSVISFEGSLPANGKSTALTDKGVLCRTVNRIRQSRHKMTLMTRMIGQCAVKLFIFACSVKFNTKKCRFVRNDVPADSVFYAIISFLLFVLARTTGSFLKKSFRYSDCLIISIVTGCTSFIILPSASKNHFLSLLSV